MARFFSRWTIPLIFLVSLWISANLKWGNQWKYTIISDAKGYYAYLPAIFIYDDLQFSFFDSIENKYYDAHTKFDFRSGYDGKTINKYFCGVAVLQAPFFLAGHAAALITAAEADGYSKPYVIFVCLGALFYLLVGLSFLRVYLLMHRASGGQAAFIVALIFFGTNLFYYSLVEPGMSHVYSFALVSMFLVYSKRLLAGNTKMLVPVALLLGMIFLVRPVNLLIILWLPFEAGGLKTLAKKIAGFFREPVAMLISLLVFILPITFQVTIYFEQTGSYFIDAYGKEGFNFSRPELVNFLFSYKKGLFIYLPLTLVAIFGLIPLWKTDRLRSLYAFLFLIVLIYVLASWWQWYYGGSFGTRVIVEFLPVFALLLFFLLRALKNTTQKIILVSLLVVLALFCQFQTYQYRYYLIHWSEMTREKYWDVFLKLPG
ncbi:MAG TPA: hypothetical protein VI731_11080 [Bacteroidia bacterium]|nr:hypothetical protein [Bacteroidia bacterium]